MNPEERHLLERTLKLSEDNNRILKKMQRAARWAIVWGVIKLALIIVPLVVGYFVLEPYLEEAVTNYDSVKEAFQTLQQYR